MYYVHKRVDYALYAMIPTPTPMSDWAFRARSTYYCVNDSGLYSDVCSHLPVSQQSHASKKSDMSVEDVRNNNNRLVVTCDLSIHSYF